MTIARSCNRSVEAHLGPLDLRELAHNLVFQADFSLQDLVEKSCLVWLVVREVGVRI